MVSARPERSPASRYQLAVFGDTLGASTVDLVDGEFAVVIRLRARNRRTAETLAASWARATLSVVGLGDWAVETLALDELASPGYIQ